MVIVTVCVKFSLCGLVQMTWQHDSSWMVQTSNSKLASILGLAFWGLASLHNPEMVRLSNETTINGLANLGFISPWLLCRLNQLTRSHFTAFLRGVQDGIQDTGCPVIPFYPHSTPFKSLMEALRRKVHLDQHSVAQSDQLDAESQEAKKSKAWR